MTKETTKTDGAAYTQPDADLSGVTIVELIQKYR